MRYHIDESSLLMKWQHFCGFVVPAGLLVAFPELSLVRYDWPGTTHMDNEKNIGENEFFRLEETVDKPRTRTIIDFEADRKAQKRARSGKRQRYAAPLEQGRLPCRLPEDWLEFAATMVLFLGSLSGFYVGLTGSWQGSHKPALKPKAFWTEESQDSSFRFFYIKARF
jgi:hypothetical protein